MLNRSSGSTSTAGIAGSFERSLLPQQPCGKSVAKFQCKHHSSNSRQIFLPPGQGSHPTANKSAISRSRWILRHRTSRADALDRTPLSIEARGRYLSLSIRLARLCIRGVDRRNGCRFFMCLRKYTGRVARESYIDSWLGLLKADNRAIFRASSQARCTSEYVLDLERQLKQTVMDDSTS